MKREDEDLLIQQAKLGKQDAFTELYDRYHKLIRYIIYDIVKNEDVEMTYYLLHSQKHLVD